MIARALYDEARVVVVEKVCGVTSEDVARALALKLVHRIDKPTSGLLMLARDARTVQRMQRLLRAGEVERVYAFVAHGQVETCTIDTTLVDDRGDGKRGSGPGGKRAVTHVRALVHGALAGGGEATMGEAMLVTGRTHQVRIHLAERGHPIVGDRVYGALTQGDHARLEQPALCLHARRLRFPHPNLGGAIVEVESEVPERFGGLSAAMADLFPRAP